MSVAFVLPHLELWQLRTEMGLEGAKLFVFVEKQQKLEEVGKEKRRKLEEERRKYRRGEKERSRRKGREKMERVGRERREAKTTCRGKKKRRRRDGGKV